MPGRLQGLKTGFQKERPCWVREKEVILSPKQVGSRKPESCLHPCVQVICCTRPLYNIDPNSQVPGPRHDSRVWGQTPLCPTCGPVPSTISLAGPGMRPPAAHISNQCKGFSASLRSMGPGPWRNDHFWNHSPFSGWGTGLGPHIPHFNLISGFYYIHLWGWHASGHIEVREELSRVLSPLHHVGLRVHTQVIRLAASLFTAEPSCLPMTLSCDTEKLCPYNFLCSYI